MKVLHLPYNIANWSTIHIKSLNKFDGIQAKGLIFGEKHVFHDHDQLIYVSQGSFIKKLRSLFIFIKHVKRADVIHWYWDEKIFPNDLA